METRIDYKKLRETCIKPVNDFFGEYPKNVNTFGNEKYIFIDNHSDILGVAHIDTVFPECNDFIKYPVQGETFIFSPNLDDRIGVYSLIDFIPRMGINLDVLITEGEETGFSSAFHFKTNKQYKWVIEFDRAGLNPVLYQYKTPEIETALKGIGLTIETGSFSDISELGGLNCVCINWGIGYTGQHTKLNRVLESDYLNTMKRFQRFHSRYKNTHFPYVEKYPRYSFRRDNLFDWKSDSFWDDIPPESYTGKKGKKHGKKYQSVNGAGGTVSIYPACLWCGETGNEIEYYPEYESHLCGECVSYWDRNGNQAGGMRAG